MPTTCSVTMMMMMIFLLEVLLFDCITFEISINFIYSNFSDNFHVNRLNVNNLAVMISNYVLA